ncbi:Ig-like domain-containing protein [Curtobacterium sp. RHCJP20]|uniref:Ig-like domain-containing protein n=1 Tax=Curtobacterium subtropicum TaxID=3055138 RepID=A0ABT7TCX0_9MICO|nr:Ig-like domain-containing protein [Curtobacterium subtropicum]MDM7887425.1 Ig-like domain-containing protein [Curtobacterium subtropicum]
MLGVALLGAVGVTQAVVADPAAAATALSCDQNTLYAINTAQNQLAAIDATTGAVTNVTRMDPADNALAVARNGVAAYAAVNNGNTITSYDAVNGVRNPDVTNADPSGNHQLLRGAINPATGIYYYASGANPAYLGAYDTKTGTKIGQVGTIGNLLTGKNGDMAFSTRGLLFVVTGNQIRRVDGDTVPTTAGTTALTSTLVATLPIDASTAGSPGIGFSADGYLFASVGSTVYKIDPGSGKQVGDPVTIAGGYTPSDLATCNYANTLSAQSSVDHRWASGDQFALEVTGGGVSTGNTATTADSTDGVQSQKAGAVLTTPKNRYTATQKAAGTTDLANYATTWRAENINSGAVIAQGDGNTAAFDFPAATSADGTDVVVTFANTVKATHVATTADTATTTSGTAVTKSAADGVLANDSGTGLSVVSNTQPAHGSATVRPDGSYTYTPAAGFSGTDSFTYTAKDSSGQTATSTVTVTVTPKGTDDAFSVRAGGTASADAANGLLANDGGSDLTITSHTDPTHGTLELGKDGSYRYTPAPGFSGTDSFTYTATDGNGATTTATVTVTVTPAAAADSITVTAGGPTTVGAPGLLGNDQGTDLTVTGSTQPAHGTVTVGSDGSYTYTPADGYSGNDSFDYTVTDGNGKSDTVTVTVLVRPAANDDTLTTRAGETLTTTTRQDGLLGNDRGTGLTVTGNTQPAHGALTLNPDGTYSYVPATGFSGTDTFQYTVTDAAGTVATATVTVVVPPTAKDDTASTAANTPVTVDVQRNDLGTSLGTQIATQPAHGTAAVDDQGRIEYRPTTDWSGTDTLTYQVVDKSGRSSAQATVTITVAPIARSDDASTTAGTPVTVPASTLLRNDSGAGLTVTGVSRATDGTVALDADGNAVYTPADGFSGTGTFWYDVRDASGGTASSWVVVIVGPQATADTATVPASTTLTVGEAKGVLANDQGTGLTATLDEEPLHGTVDLAADGSYTYTPTADWSGSDRFTYTATDSSGQKSTGLVTITVTPRTEDDRIRTAADQPVTVTSGDLTGNDHGSGLTVTSVGQPSAGTVVLNADGTITYTPAPGTSGTATFPYGVTGANGNTAEGTVTVTITPVVVANDADATADGTLVVPADKGVLAGATGTDLAVTDNTDPGHGTVEVGKDGSYTYTPEPGYSGKDTFDVTITDGSGNTTTGTVTITVAPKAVDDAVTTTTDTPVDVPVLRNDKGTALRVTGVGTAANGTVRTTDTGVTYTPAAGWSGTDTFTYTVTDGTGSTATATVTVTVTPTAGDDVLQTPANTSLAISPETLTGNDTGSGLTVTGATEPRHGTVTKAADGTLVYTPTTGWSGTDTFAYTVTDASGQTATATVTVLVGAVATPDQGTTTTNGTLTVPAERGVLADDSGTGLTATLDRKPQHGTVDLAKDGSYVYTPAEDFSGTDTFTYTATDAEGQTSTGLVTITVTPTAGADAARTTAGTPVTVRGPGVLGNDRGSALRVASVGRAQHGTVTIAADGTFVYTPEAGFSGVDTVTYEVVDAEGQHAEALVTITVGIAAADDSASTVAGTAIARDAQHGLLGNDRGTGLTAALDRGPAHGTVTVRPDGSYVYTPTTGFTGTDRFTYTVTDASGQTTTATAVMTVVAAATATDDSAVGAVDHPVTIRPIDNDHASGGAHFVPSTLHLVDPASGAPTDRVVVQGMGTWQVQDGTVVFTPEHGWAARTSIDYTVLDSAAQMVRATIEVSFPTGLAAAAHIAKLAFTGTTGLVGLGLAAVAMVLAGLFLVVRRRGGGATVVTGTRRRSGS